MMDASWRIELLGGLRATQGDRVITRFRRHKTGALLAFLAYHRHRAHPRQALIELLWPESDPQAGHNRLRVALSSLRHQLEPPGLAQGTVLLADRHAVQLNPAICTTDVAQFDAALQAVEQTPSAAGRGQRLLEAAERYRGELLPGYFEEWIQPERQRLTEAYHEILDQLIRLLEEAGDLRGAIEWARRAVSADALREESQHQLIRLLAADGRFEAACRQYQALERRLADSCGTAPDPEIRAFARTLEREKRLAAARSPEGRPAALVAHEIGEVGHSWAALPLAPAAPAVPRGHLPPPLTRFFGREDELEQLQALLSPAVSSHPSRLVTLTGAGGSGKTRLALAAAGRLWSCFHGAVWFVPLADVSDPRLVVDKLLESLSRHRSPGAEVWEQVTTFLRRQPSLLVLDNFEHLVSEGALVVRSLLDEVPTLTVLVTSRQRLALAGERQFPVAPLPVPVESLESRVERPATGGPTDLATRHSPLLSPARACSSLWSGHRPCDRIFSSLRGTLPRSSAFAGSLRGCRWAWNWPQPGSGRSPRLRCWPV